MQTECSCIIINCNRTRVYLQLPISMQIPGQQSEEGNGLKCHCKSIKTDDLFRCLIRCWSVVPVPGNVPCCPHGVIFLLLYVQYAWQRYL